MGKIGNRGRTSGAPQLSRDRCSGRGDGVQAVPLAAGTVRAVTCEVLGETKSLNKFASGLIRRSRGASSKKPKQQHVTVFVARVVLEAW